MQKSKFLLIFISCLIFSAVVSAQVRWEDIPKTRLNQPYEIKLTNNNKFENPFADVTLHVEFTSPFKEKHKGKGFYDGENTWKIKFSPDEPGIWAFMAYFSGSTDTLTGYFGCMSDTDKGRIGRNEFNPFWMNRNVKSKELFKSFHVGDRFFATNWDDPEDDTDGNKRTIFLDWLQKNGYNMISVASLFTNRNDEGRGRGWNTPKLWPLNLNEFKILELILDELNRRDIVVFPFAGFFGLRGEWPTIWKDQQLYLDYIMARIGHYPNIIYNVAGPEPFWAEYGYKNAMRLNDIIRIGSYIKENDMHSHILTVHNETRATEYGDPFIDEPWCDMSTLQGPKTLNANSLFSGLIMNHRPTKLAYAQETLWTGNIYHPMYSDNQIRKNVFAILFSGSILNFADNNGNSSSGFSGTLDPKDVNQHYHDIVSRVHEWFENIPFHQMRARQDLVNNGFCLANEGVEYYIYLDKPGKTELYLDYPYSFDARWINAQNFDDVRKDTITNKTRTYHSPADGDDWILHVFANKPTVVANGNFPDIAVDNEGNIHLAYNRNGLKYKKYSKATKTWGDESDVGCKCDNVQRSEPDIVVDSKGRPHLFCGIYHAYPEKGKWIIVNTGATRDTELAIDKNDNIYLVHRGGNNGGYIGFRIFDEKKREWKSLTDPDRNSKGVNDHVYPDLFITENGQIHLVQRHGPRVEITYRRSNDGGKTWPIEEDVSDSREEGPHIAVDSEGRVYITSGVGELFERDLNGRWSEIGRKVKVHGRMQPEIEIDTNDNIYITGFGGRYNTRLNNIWMGERIIDPLNPEHIVGFVEPKAVNDFAFIVWEEGKKGNPDQGMDQDSDIIVGILYPDGRIVGLF